MKRYVKSVSSASNQDKVLLAKDGEWELWQPLTYEGSISLAEYGGEKAKWITTHPGGDAYWNWYSDRGPLYVFINTGNPRRKYQSCPGAESWLHNFNDKDLGKFSLLRFLGQHKPFAEALDLHIERSSKFFVMDSELFQFSEVASLGGKVITESRPVVVESYLESSDVTLPKGTKLYREAFANNQNLQHVSLPKGTNVAQMAFTNCKSLKAVDLPSDLQTLEWNCFQNCKSLTEIVIPDSVVEIKNSAFLGCKSLRSVDLPSGLIDMYPKCFSGCSSLEEIVIPDSVTDISDDTFKGCKNLTVFIHTDEFDDIIEACGVKEIVHDF